MADLPYMNSPNAISKILEKIIEAKTPQKYTQDFQKTVIGLGSGGAMAFIPLLKKLEFINSDGTPNQSYRDFRSGDTRGSVMALAIKKAFSQLYNYSEYAHILEDKKLKDAIIKITGLESSNQAIGYIFSTFKNLCSFADFDNISHETILEKNTKLIPLPLEKEENEEKFNSAQSPRRDMTLSYTINLNLPETKDIAVFDAIFSSLKQHLLR